MGTPPPSHYLSMGRLRVGAWTAAVAVVALASAAAVGHAEDRGPVTRHTMWRIEGGHAPVCLLGSIHLLHRQNYPLERPIEDAFDEARVVAFEIALDEARTAMRPVEPVRVARRPAQQPSQQPALRSGVSKTTYDAVVRYLENAGLPGTTLDQVPPPLVSRILLSLELQRLGFDPDWGVDAYFYRRAQKYGKTIVPLETVAEQLGVLGTMSEQGHDELIQATLQDVASMRTNLRDLIRAWKGGELDQIETLVNASFHDRPEVYQHLLVDRNARWIPKIESLLAGDRPALVIVGTGHLVGADSVVAMLRAKGWVVRQQ